MQLEEFLITEEQLEKLKKLGFEYKEETLPTWAAIEKWLLDKHKLAMGVYPKKYNDKVKFDGVVMWMEPSKMNTAGAMSFECSTIELAKRNTLDHAIGFLDFDMNYDPKTRKFKNR